ncbi:UNVERIFIED_CONTAM: hypothetical protein GTU68_055562 [Idotea baltica]|nr:hypothetical protein [Idotea baltica]
MARAPLLQLSDISLTFGGDPVLDALDLVVQAGDRLALVGRNGSGKSTLMKVMAGLVASDAGQVVTPAGVSVGYMEQDPDLSGFETLAEFAFSGLPDGDEYKVEIAAEGLKLSLDRSVSAASGGERRRTALARLLAQAPELMLLDEPTNHLDIEAIGWLEDHLASTGAAFVVISHDRAFLRAVTRGTLWIDRGQVRRQEKGFDAFEAWRDKIWQEEDVSRHKLDRKIKAEARWAVEGISARRKRNQGRVRALQDLRQQRSDMIRRQGTADLVLEGGEKSGKVIIDAKDISKSFDDHVILHPFSLRIARGERVALVGPNGVGKTTVLKMLIGAMAPDSGIVKLGTNLDVAVFDQNRDHLRLDETLWDNLTSEEGLQGSGRTDQVMVRGAPRHVVGYLKDFLFDEAQARAPVRSLSGGEKARLLLAKIMAHPSNLLVLDEPTNDLDIETMDLLQELLSEFDGTVLLVSHDRDFLDRVATTTVAMESDGRAVIYAGGWSDYQAQRKQPKQAVSNLAPASKTPGSPKAVQAARDGAKLTFTEKHRLEELPDEMDQLAAEISKLEALLSDPALFTRDPLKFKKASAAMVARQATLAKAEEDWLTLEEKASS